MTIEHLAAGRTARIITLRTLVAAFLFVGSLNAHAADPNKVLRIASDDIDTLDPVQLQDYYSQQIATVIFQGLYEWDYLGNPPRPVPRTAVALPTYSADRKTWTIKVKPGIFFADDPAFKGAKRELTAADYVYAFKRVLDPRMRSNSLQMFEGRFVAARASFRRSYPCAPFSPRSVSRSSPRRPSPRIRRAT